MRVLLQYNCIPHYRLRIFELLSACEEVEFTIVADNDSETPFLKTITTGDGLAIRFISATNHILKLPGIPELYWQPGAVRKFLAMRPDALIALGSPYSFTAWTLAMLGRLLGIPVLLWGHGLLGDESGPKWWLRRALYKLAHGQLLYGNYARDLLIRKGFDPDRLFVVNNSLDYDEQEKVASTVKESDVADFRARLGMGKDHRLVVFTGRLQPVKRLDMLVEAAGKLSRSNRIVHVAFIGEGSERDALAAQAEHLGIASNVHFLGASYDEKYLGLVLSAADLSVIPSGAGLSIMHSMIYGTPVLLHDRLDRHFPEWEAVTEGKTGMFYKYDDIDDLVGKMAAALFPEPCKPRMQDECKQVIRELYNPHRQVEWFVNAVRSSVA